MNETTSDVSHVRRDKITTLSLIVICQSFQALTIGGISLFLPIIRTDLNLSFTLGGTLASASSFVYALMQVPAGYAVDRWGARRVFLTGVLGTTILSFTFGLVTNYWQALANQTVSGFFRALLFAPGMLLFSGWFPPDRRATAMGLYMVGGFSGNVLLDIIGPLLVREFGWRFPFITFSIGGIMAALALLRFGRQSPTTRGPQKGNFREALQLFRFPVMWVCALVQYVRLAVMAGITFWLPSLLVDEKLISLQITGFIVAMRACIQAPSNIVGGYASDRLKNPCLVIGFSLAMIGATASLFTVVNNMILLVIIIGINSFFVQMYFGPLFSVPVEIFGTRNAGMLTGFSNFFANIGNFSFTFILGVIKDTTGSFEYGFFTIAATCAVGVAATTVLAGMRRRALAEAPAD